MFFKSFWAKHFHPRIYLDYASSTPIDVQMMRTFPKIPDDVLAANPHALHQEGVRAKRILEDSRARVASTIGAHPNEIIFTSGASESNNLAIQGIVNTYIEKGTTPNDIVVYVSALEHASVREILNHIEKKGVQTGVIPAEEGIVDPKTILLPEGAKVLLISVMYVNNEIGTMQPIAAIAKRVRYLRKHHPETQIYFHIDATQAPVYVPLSIPKLGVDMMTLGATKLYCPKGIGVLYKKRNVTVSPIVYGGGQEFGLRPGTESISLIHNFSYALTYAQQHVDQEREHCLSLQQLFEGEVVKRCPHVLVTAKDKERSPHISHIAIKDFDSELLVILLDAKRIAVSAKSACKNDNDEESSLVSLLYGPGVGSVRFSFGRTTTKRQVIYAAKMLQHILKFYKKL